MRARDDYKRGETFTQRGEEEAHGDLVRRAKPCVGTHDASNSAVMKHLSTYLSVVALAPALLGAQASAGPVLRQGHAYTVDNARPAGSASAVRAGRILFVGADAQ